MKDKDTRNLMKSILKKLEVSGQKIIQTRGYTNEVAKLKLLEELLKEQLHNENSGSTAR